jgi:hypothetical protein
MRTARASYGARLQLGSYELCGLPRHHSFPSAFSIQYSEKFGVGHARHFLDA